MKRRTLFIISLLLSMISSIIGKAQQVIDVHSHMIPQSYLDYLSENHALLDYERMLSISLINKLQ